MDFGHNDPARQRLEQEPYWKQYGWMDKLGLKGPRTIVFALIFERDCTEDPARDRITSKYIARALDEGCPVRGRGESGIARVFKVLNELSAKGLVCADMDEDGLSMSFKCDYDAVESILAGAAGCSADIEPTSESSEGEVDGDAYDKMS